MAIQQLVQMIQARLKHRLHTLQSLNITTIDLSAIPDQVKIAREQESAKIRAVMQEQTDLIDIIQMLFPNVKPAAKAPRKKATAKKDAKS